jgi:hypothetical protein
MAENNDDEMPQLSAETFDALQEFLKEEVFKKNISTKS